MVNGLITDYKAGMQVTIQDDNGKEDILIDSVADPVINFKSQIQGTYSAGANVYRSNLTDDWKFGGFSSMGVIDKTTPSQLVNAPDSTIGNVGRRGCADDDGNMYFATVTANSLRVTKEGVGEIYSFNTGNTINGLSITYAQNRLHLIVNGNTFTEVKYIALDLTGIELVNTPLDSGQTAIGKCDITVNEFGGKNKILATWASINASLPTYFNIRAVEGTISGGVVTWGSITQITNEAARNVTDPTAKFINGDNPLIIYDDNDNLKCEIIGSSAFTIETSGGYNKDNLSATFMPPSKVIETGVDLGNPTDNANAQANGILLVAYEGKDPTDTTKNNIRCKISVNASAAVWLDFGVSGSKVTQGNVTEYRLPSPSWNDKGEFFLMYYKDSGNIYQSKWDTLWTVNTQITTNSDISPNCVDNYHNYDEPITFYQDTTDSDVKIYGKWTAGLLTPVTEIDIRVNIEAFTDKTEISAFLETNDFDTVTLDGFLSIHADGADETYIDTTDVKIDEGTNNMYLSAGSVVTPQDKATMKYQLTRASTSDAVEIKRVQGGLLWLSD